MSNKDRQPARISDRLVYGFGGGEFETVEFARRRDKRRRQRDLAKQARKKNRHG